MNATTDNFELRTLTKIELEVLRWRSKGLSYSEIARQISRSPRTVDNHLQRIGKKVDRYGGRLIAWAAELRVLGML